jgi:uncharacterized protein YegP (UPF0339 family)
MRTRTAHRGERRIRVALEIKPRSARVAGIWPLEGPAVQRPALDGTHVAQVLLAGATVLIQSFDDPLLVRGVAPPGELGHSYARAGSALINVDVPLPQGDLPGEIAIRIVDLSKLSRRPTDPEGVQALLDAQPRQARTLAEVNAAQLVEHPDWATLGLRGVPSIPPAGGFEIYLDRASRFRWRLRRPDGQIVADSSQGYNDRAACEADLRWIREHGATASIRSLDLLNPPISGREPGPR